ncbi:MAG: transketolase, N-terminal section [Chlamydiales bacterium]|jgi:transketolase|nr:transketolase, N-terminal section [Chlamydiales bacterium]
MIDLSCCNINLLARQIRHDILIASHVSGHGHIPTCFSVVEMLLATYQSMQYNPKNPQDPQRDLFVLSKGHAALAHYATLARLGYFEPASVRSFGNYGSLFGCHADRLKVPGVEASTGSLGHGIALAVGMALGFKIDHKPNRVFTLVGDGEANEGSVWEAAMVASDLKLANLTVLYDNNLSQKRCLQIYNPEEKFEAFGFDTYSVDGHNVEQINNALEFPNDRPKVIICNTQKGYGCPSLVNEVFSWHRRAPKEEELKTLLGELYAQTV